MQCHGPLGKSFAAQRNEGRCLEREVGGIARGLSHEESGFVSWFSERGKRSKWSRHNGGGQTGGGGLEDHWKKDGRDDIMEEGWPEQSKQLPKGYSANPAATW